MEIDARSYIAGFVQGLIACEMLVLIIKITIDMHRNKQDMKEFEKMSNKIAEDTMWSKIVVDRYTETNKRLGKIVEKLNIEEDKDE